MSRFIFLLLIIWFSACTGTNDVPKDLIPPDKMERILWDMIQADQYFQTYILKDSAIRPVSQERFKLYDKVFDLHKVDREKFEKSYDYYAKRPAVMKKMFDSLAAQGSRRIPESYAPLPTPK